MSATVGQAILAMFESDLATVGGQPLETLLMNLKTHAGNTPMQVADWIQFTAAAPGAGLVLGVDLEQQLLSAAIVKLQAFMAAKQAPAAPVPGISG